VRNARNPASSTHHLGVRLTESELELLDRFRIAQHRSTRSDAVRLLVQSIAQPKGDVELPATLAAELEEVVEDGWATDINGAMVAALTLGLRELTQLHTEGLPSLRAKARSHAERKAGQRRADREGRGLLRR
jgi:hypothetical protein